jgi:hypothetical protein
MRYSNDTKDFLWTGGSLLGGQFLRFMRGFVHEGHFKSGCMSKGIYDPQASEINCPVPSERTLNEYQPIDLIVPCQFSTGIIKKNINLYAQALPTVSRRFV